MKATDSSAPGDGLYHLTGQSNKKMLGEKKEAKEAASEKKGVEQLRWRKEEGGDGELPLPNGQEVSRNNNNT